MLDPRVKGFFKSRAQERCPTFAMQSKAASIPKRLRRVGFAAR